MATPFDFNMVVRRPPHGIDSEGPKMQQFTTAGAGSTAQLDILGADNVASYVVCRFYTVGAAVGTLIGYVRWGPNLVNPASNTDWKVLQGEIWEWLAIGAQDRYCRMIRNGAVDMGLDVYKSDVSI